MKRLLALIIITIGLNQLSSDTYGQQFISKYEKVELFSGMNLPVGIGLFKINGDDNFEEELLAILDGELSSRKMFVFYPYKSLNSLKDTFEIDSLDSNNLKVLNRLRNNLNIKLILEGESNQNGELKIKLIETEKGNVIFSNIYTKSKNSTPILDLSKLFVNQETARYKNEVGDLPEMSYVEKGKIVVNTLYNRGKKTLNIKDDFYISKYECTIKQFAEFINATGYKTDAEKEGVSWFLPSDKSDRKNIQATWQDDEYGNSRDENNRDFPVLYVSWNDAIKYCEWLSDQTGENYSLPSLDEWQFAVVGGNHSKYFACSGSNHLEKVGWYKDNSDLRLHKIGTKNPNELDLYDMSGNVREWCLDQPQDTSETEYRYVANGSWLDREELCYSSFYHRWHKNYRTNFIGFRIIKKIVQGTSDRK